VLVSQILKTKGGEVVAIERHRSIRDAAQLMIQSRIGAVLVRDDSGICGIISERDVTRGLALRGEDAAAATVETVMTRDVITCAPTDHSDDLMTLMTNQGVRHLPVLSGGELNGIVSMRDIVKARLTELESHSEALQTYITSSM